MGMAPSPITRGGVTQPALPFSRATRAGCRLADSSYGQADTLERGARSGGGAVRGWGRRPAALAPRRMESRAPGGPLPCLFVPDCTHQGGRLAPPRPYRADAGVPRSADQGAEEGQQAAAPPGWGSAASPLPPLHSGAHPCTCSGRESRAWPTAHAPRPERWDGDAMQFNPSQFLEVITKKHVPTLPGLLPYGWNRSSFHVRLERTPCQGEL